MRVATVMAAIGLPLAFLIGACDDIFQQTRQAATASSASSSSSSPSSGPPSGPLTDAQKLPSNFSAR